MPKLPGEEDLRRKTPSAGRAGAMVGQPRTVQNYYRNPIDVTYDSGAGEGLQGMGKAMVEIGEMQKEKEELQRQQDEKNRQAKAKLELASAKSQWARKQIEVEKKFIGDTDYATYEKRYSEEMSAAMEDIGQGIESATVRRGFYQDSSVDTAKGSLRMLNSSHQAFQREGLLKIDNEIAANLDALANTDNEFERAALFYGTLGLLDTMGKFGVSEEAIKKNKRTNAKAAARIVLVSMAGKDPHQTIEDIEAGRGYASYLSGGEGGERDDLNREIRANFNADQNKIKTETTMKAYKQFPGAWTIQTGTGLRDWRDKQAALATTPEEKTLVEHTYEVRKNQLTLTEDEQYKAAVRDGKTKGKAAYEVRKWLIDNEYRAPNKDAITNNDIAENKRLFSEKMVALGIKYDEETKEYVADESKVKVDDIYQLQKELAGLRDGYLSATDILKLQTGLDGILQDKADGKWAQAKHPQVLTKVMNHLARKYDPGGWFDRKGNEASKAPSSAISRMVGLAIEEAALVDISEGATAQEKMDAYSKAANTAIAKFDAWQTPTYKPANAILSSSGDTMGGSPVGTEGIESDTEVSVDPGSAPTPISITNDKAGIDAYNALSSGSSYIDPNGVKKVKP